MAASRISRGDRTGDAKILWLGGSSALARTYVNEFGGRRREEGLVLCGVETRVPAWLHDKQAEIGQCPISYISCDLTAIASADDAYDNLLRWFPSIETIIIGVRPPLLASQIRTNLPGKLRQGIIFVLQAAIQHLKQLKAVLHISSVAAVDHLEAQSFLNEASSQGINLQSLKAPYDRFKVSCERYIDQCLENETNSIRWMHLRLSAIFSDDRSCIQCTSMELQRAIGCYVPVAIDCNSSLNVARAIQQIIQQLPVMGEPAKYRVLYYTRPLHMPQPIAYGEYLKIYRQAYKISFPNSFSRHFMIWIPSWIHVVLVNLVRWLALLNQNLLNSWVPYIDAVGYLLQVSSREHFFDCSKFEEFVSSSQTVFHEETILECFARRNMLLHPTTATGAVASTGKKK